MVITNAILIAFGVFVISIESIVSKAVETYLAEKRALEQERQVSGSTNQEDLISLSEGVGSTPPITHNPSSSVELLVGSSGTALQEASASKRGKGKGTAMGGDSTTAHNTSAIDRERGKEAKNIQDTSVSEERRGKEGGGGEEVVEEVKDKQATAEEREVKSADSQDSGTVKASELSPVSFGIFMNVNLKIILHFQLSSLAQLGLKAYTAMANGEAIDDGVLIDIFVEEVGALPEGTGWILDNFPTTVAQAKVNSLKSKDV